ncbi:N-alpha-acetyltransferase 50 [Phlyctochytrium bullatum]|nr:N-alpha-acetyltransferase 50 [Phlyctochytrium bullatum]
MDTPMPPPSSPWDRTPAFPAAARQQPPSLQLPSPSLSPSPNPPFSSYASAATRASASATAQSYRSLPTHSRLSSSTTAPKPPRKPLAVLRPPNPPPFDAATATLHTTTRAAGRIILASPTAASLPLLRRLNATLFPVPYNERFYTTVLENADLCRLAFYGDECIGAVCCRRELITSLGEQGTYRVYIMTLGVLAAYRRLRIGTLLLDTLLSRCRADSTLSHLELHVHVANKEAIRFYKARDFKLGGKVEGYYLRNKGVEPPPDAFLFLMDLKPTADAGDSLVTDGRDIDAVAADTTSADAFPPPPAMPQGKVPEIA